ncbi:MAG: hypothetical protein JWR61_5342 [Ferruginibacter sp.]|uniref:glucosamine inositolphosphorylceramide transferase family protein n=1 Tax=Ferruginibacter sp. TaxID=1940288 RepID=UPI00265B726D|nr:hypothetical protein [Ferruginibacter sp.]MDB5280387.1 hypothetical protein [Ferruginibacter sp.]
MSLLSKVLAKCSVMQWRIAIAHGDIATIIREKKIGLHFTSLPNHRVTQFMADPFIFLTQEGLIKVLYEEFSFNKKGIIILKTIDSDFKILSQKTLLKSSGHLSYPLVFTENGTTYVIPESHEDGDVNLYEYDLANDILVNKQLLIQQPLLDVTVLRYNQKYWIFATMGDGTNDNADLHIFYADSLKGPYKAHFNNPVKSNLNGSRPAGNFIEVDGNIYRPSQNSSEYYGKSMTIHRISRLTERDFEEVHHMDINGSTHALFKTGAHTINARDNIIAVDYIQPIFSPLTKAIMYLKKNVQ